MDKLVILGIIAAVILLALVACGLVALLIYTQQPAQPLLQGPANQSPTPVVTANTSPNSTISDQNFALWMMITKQNVESACFNKAKQEAGSNAWAVNGCTCQETVTPDHKRYDCTIDTAVNEGTYFAKVDCALSGEICSVTTNFGAQNVTFDQLRQMYSGG